MAKRLSQSTVLLENKPRIFEFAAVCGKKESEGPLGSQFDKAYDDNTFGEETWEKAESRLQTITCETVFEKSKLNHSDIDVMFAGDLLNQCVGSAYGLRDLNIPFYGLYGACSTMAESLSLSALFIEGGLASKTLAVTSSHFCSSERQFRFPLEYGGQRTPTSQWTATASGAIILSKDNGNPYINAICTGKIKDLGITDANNMGAAMAPAAADTIKTYLTDTNTSPSDYDMIFTGDLGLVGTELLYELLSKDNIDLSGRHNDCGLILFDREAQDVHAGASGCGCSAGVLCSHILPSMRKGKLNNILFVATGALMSPTSVQQGQSIPGIAHLVHIKTEKES